MRLRLLNLAHRLVQQVTRNAGVAPRIAVLIDGDGVSAKDADRALVHIRSLGRVCALRCYGNFSGTAKAAWTNLVKRWGAVARHLPSVAPGKNATDIALTIDAIEILLTKPLDTFVIIASDADFTPLALRIREEGKDVIGFGGRSASQSFKDACTSFHDIRYLDTSPTTPPSPAHWSRQPADAEEMILSALTSLGWEELPVSVNTLGKHLAVHYPGFDPRAYRRRTLSDLLRDLPSVDLIQLERNSYARPRAPEK